jgi:hypothetical protein
MTQNNMGASDPIGQFVSRLVEEKGLMNLEAEVLDQVKKDLYDRVERRINAAVVENIPPEKIEYFEKLAERGDSGEIQSFAKRNIPGLDGIIAKELVGFRDTYLNLQ